MISPGRGPYVHTNRIEEFMAMPGFSKQTAPNVEDVGPVVDRYDDVLGYRIVPPAHTPSNTEDTEYVQFSPSEELQIVTDTIRRNFQAMQA